MFYFLPLSIILNLFLLIIYLIFLTFLTYYQEPTPPASGILRPDTPPPEDDALLATDDATSDIATCIFSVTCVVICPNAIAEYTFPVYHSGFYFYITKLIYP